MEERIFRFIAALRAARVRISLAESADAIQSVNLMGVKDRELFRISLLSTLVKEGTDIAVFEQLFTYFFDTAESPPLMDLMQDLTQEESQMLAQALREFGQKLREALERLLRGEQLSQEELEAAYARTFDVPPDWRGRRILLRCDSVQSDAEIWINGRAVTGQQGGFTAFERDLTAAWKLIPDPVPSSSEDPARASAPSAQARRGGRTRPATSMGVKT